MLCSPVLSVLLAFVASTTFAFPAEKSAIDEVITIDDLTKLKDLPQGVEVIPLSIDRSTRGLIRYTLGQRALNDQLVSQAANSSSWNTLQNVQLRLQYPVSGRGASITFVDCLVNQSSNLGRGYVTSGGVGQRSIVLIIEAYNTYNFSYNCGIFGIP